jgi:ATP/maltotriose-dependent transcriptional regulator MalT
VATIPPTPITKYRPALPTGRLVPRERLLGLLERDRHRRLTLICAPAGFGKTTLAAQWAGRLSAEAHPIVWMSMDRDDNNPAWLLAHLIEAVRWLHPGPAAELLAVLEEHGEAAAGFVIDRLVREIGRSGRTLMLVIDDWHRVGAAPAVAVLDLLIEKSTDSMHFVISSRTRDGLPLDRLRNAGQLAEIDALALRFDPAESERLLVGVGGLSLDAEDLRRVHESTDGWVAALQLASLSMRGDADPGALIATMTGQDRSIDAYLAENVLDRLPADLLDVLLRTALPERLCADLVTALIASPAEGSSAQGSPAEGSGAAWLDRIDAGDLFLRALDERRIWFRYHHLFAEFLRRRLQRDHPELVAPLHRRAALWFAAAGRSGEAVEHALAAGDPQLAVDIVADRAMLLYEHSRMSTLLALVDKLPPDLLTDRPELLIAVGWANMTFQRQDGARQAQAQLGRALSRGQGADQADGLQLEGRLLHGCIGLYQDHPEDLAEVIGICVQRADELRPWLVSAAAGIDGIMGLRRFDFAGVRRRQAWAWPYMERTGGPFAGVFGECLAASAALELLDAESSERQLSAALDWGRNLAGPHAYMVRLAAGQLGALKYQRGDLEAAERYLAEAEELGGGTLAEFLLTQHVIRPRVAALRGHRSEAERRLRAGAVVARELGLDRLAAAVAEEQAVWGFAAGDVMVAAPEPPLDGVGTAIAESREAAAIWRGLAAVADPDGLERLAGAARTRYRRIEAQHRPLAAVRARALLAATLQRAGRTRDAVQELVPALRACAPTGLVGPVADGGAPIAELLARLTATAQDRRPGPVVAGVPDAFVEAVHRQAARGPGRRPDPASAPDQGRAASPRLSLSEREQKILRLLDRGISNAQIARRLNLSANTVKWYLKALYLKFGVTRRQECVAAARAAGLLP